MNRSSFKRGYSDLRRVLKHPEIQIAGHFRREPVTLPGRINNNWLGIFNIRNKRVIALYQLKNGVVVAMIRRKSPYHMVVEKVLRDHYKPEAFMWRRIPRNVDIARLNRYTLGYRKETVQDRIRSNGMLRTALRKDNIYDARTVTRNTRRSVRTN